MTDAGQMRRDSIYWANGPCCSGCDWWSEVKSTVGLCTKSAPVSASERVAMLGMSNCTLHSGAGHVFTRGLHHCGDFQDSFDWGTLPTHYLRQIGAPRSTGAN